MTTNNALDLIKVKLGGEDSDLRNTLARSALTSAINSFNRIGNFEWNRQFVDFNLTNGTGTYLFTDLWPDYTVKGMEPRIYLVGQSGYIDVIDYEQFNTETKYRSTTSGTPQIATAHSKEGQIDIWPVPNDDYSCTAMLYVKVTGIDELDDYDDLVIDRAVMLGATKETPIEIYQAAVMSWNEGKQEIIKRTGYTVWTGNQISPDPYVTFSTTSKNRHKTDSGNLTGV